MTLEAGRAYQFDLEGASTGQGTLARPYLRGLRDSAGDWAVGSETDAGGGTGYNSRTGFKPLEDGTYYVDVRSVQTYDLGTYTLSVSDITDAVSDDYPAGTTGTVAVGGSVAGEIEVGGDRDWFAVTLDAGKTYRFDLEEDRQNHKSVLDPYLFGIHDADGTLIPGTTNDSRGTFTPSEDGTRLQYALTITDPATFTEPVTLRKYWTWRPDAQVRPFECNAEYRP